MTDTAKLDTAQFDTVISKGYQVRFDEGRHHRAKIGVSVFQKRVYSVHFRRLNLPLCRR